MSRIMPSLSGSRTWQRTVVVQAWPPRISRPGSRGRAYVHAGYASRRLGRAAVRGPLAMCPHRRSEPVQSWCNRHDPRIALSLLLPGVAPGRHGGGPSGAGRPRAAGTDCSTWHRGATCASRPRRLPGWSRPARAGHAEPAVTVKTVLIGLSRWRWLLPIFRGETDETQRRVVAALPAPVNHVLGLRWDNA
jgi:hypothetical protein